MTSFYLHGFFVWLGFLVLAMLNGATRVYFTVPKVGVMKALYLHTFGFAALLFVLSVPFVQYEGVTDAASLLTLGAMWVVLTVAFECVFGRTQGMSWEEILFEYNLAKGRPWPLFLLSLGVSPWLAEKLFGA